MATLEIVEDELPIAKQMKKKKKKKKRWTTTENPSYVEKEEI